jgi:hypothetical protein
VHRSWRSSSNLRKLKDDDKTTSFRNHMKMWSNGFFSDRHTTTQQSRGYCTVLHFTFWCLRRYNGSPVCLLTVRLPAHIPYIPIYTTFALSSYFLGSQSTMHRASFKFVALPPQQKETRDKEQRQCIPISPSFCRIKDMPASQTRQATASLQTHSSPSA